MKDLNNKEQMIKIGNKTCRNELIINFKNEIKLIILNAFTSFIADLNYLDVNNYNKNNLISWIDKFVNERSMSIDE